MASGHCRRAGMLWAGEAFHVPVVPLRAAEGILADSWRDHVQQGRGYLGRGSREGAGQAAGSDGGLLRSRYRLLGVGNRAGEAMRAFGDPFGNFIFRQTCER